MHIGVHKEVKQRSYSILGLIYHFNKEGLGFEEQIMGKGLGNIWGKLKEDKGYFG